MGHSEEIELIKQEMHKCKTNVYTEIENIKIELARQAEQRIAFNESINYKIDKLTGWFTDHDTKEMEKYSEIVEGINKLVEVVGKLTEQTEDNADFIDTVKKYWFRITMIGTGVMITLGSLYWLYTFLERHGMVIVFEKAL